MSLRLIAGIHRGQGTVGNGAGESLTRAALTVCHYLHISAAGLPWQRLFTQAAEQKAGQTVSIILIFFFSF